MMAAQEARAHHFVPKCWLAGFTDSGEADGVLFVTDLTRKRQWRCRPSEVGHRRDLNRIDNPMLSDPLTIEKMFSGIENDVAPIFRALNEEKRGPKDSFELSMLLEYMAIQWVRVPTSRAIIGSTVYSHVTDSALSTPEMWSNTLQKAAVEANQRDAEYSTIVEALASGKAVRSTRPVEYLQYWPVIVQEIDNSLKSMFWCWLLSPTGQFISSDSPVGIDAPSGHPVGFKRQGIVTYAANRHLLLIGTQEPVTIPTFTTEIIARHNTFAMLSADEQVYSHRCDFHWLGASGKCQNDWTLFSADDFYLPGANRI
jgi:hypothetical protein